MIYIHYDQDEERNLEQNDNDFGALFKECVISVI